MHGGGWTSTAWGGEVPFLFVRGETIWKNHPAEFSQIIRNFLEFLVFDVFPNYISPNKISVFSTLSTIFCHIIILNFMSNVHKFALIRVLEQLFYHISLHFDAISRHFTRLHPNTNGI